MSYRERREEIVLRDKRYIQLLYFNITRVKVLEIVFSSLSVIIEISLEKLRSAQMPLPGSRFRQ